MRILIYTHAFASKVGGTETYVKLLAEGLAARPEVRNARAMEALSRRGKGVVAEIRAASAGKVEGWR